MKIVSCYDSEPPSKRACINCGLRDLWGVGSRCRYNGHYIRYGYERYEWCKHWHKDKREPWEIEVYDDAR